MQWFLTAAMFVFLTLFQEGSVPVATMPAVDVCELVHSKAAYSGKRLQVSGIVLGENLDHLMLISPNCQFGVQLAFSPEVQTHQDVQTLFRAVRRGNPGTTDRDITADFFGTYLYSERGSILQLQVDKIERLSVPKK